MEIIDRTKQFSRDNIEKNNGFQTNLDNAMQYNWAVEWDIKLSKDEYKVTCSGRKFKLSVDVCGSKTRCNHSRTKRDIVVNRIYKSVSTVLKGESSTDST